MVFQPTHFLETILKKYLWDYAQLIVIAGTAVTLDQLSKAWVRANLSVGFVYKPEAWLSQFARIIHLHNRGAALGIFEDMSALFLALGVIIGCSIVFYYPRIPRRDWSLRLGLGLILAGAIGNPIDRLLHQGYVTDFISLGNLPVFNLADLSISIGTAILIVGAWIQDRSRKMHSTSIT
jgi:signal peptidase II